jgi:hypothetical protein
MLRSAISAISAFTRVFDALWRCAADPGAKLDLLDFWSRPYGAPLERCTVSGT